MAAREAARAARWLLAALALLAPALPADAAPAAAPAGLAEPAAGFLLDMERSSPEGPAIREAKALLAQGQWQQALEALAPVIRAGSGASAEDRAHGLMLAAAALAGAGDRQRGLALLNEAAALRPSSLAIRLQRARIDLEAGLDAEAEQALRQALKQGGPPADPELSRWVAALWYRLGVAAEGRGETGAALARWKEAWRADPGTALYPLRYAAAARAAGQLEEAAQAFEAGLSLLGSEAPAGLLTEAGFVELALRRFERASSLLERAVAASPGDTEALYGFGLALAALGRDDEARRFLEQAVAASPTHWRARFALSTVLARAGERSRARAQLEEAVRLAPAVPELRAALGRAYLEAGRYREAEDQLQAALALGQTKPEVLYALGESRFRDRRFQDAAASFAAAAQLETDDRRRALYLYAQALATEAAGDAASAIELLRRSASLDPSRFDAQLRLGELLLAAGDAASALEPLRRAAALQPGDARVQRALQAAARAAGGG